MGYLAQSTAGAWTANIRREGEAGFGKVVSIVGGNWTLQRPDGTVRWGRVLRGHVQWPDDREDDLGCGDGVAWVEADVSLGLPWGWPWRRAGEIAGCLDDQDWLGDEPPETLRLPPQIWVTLSLRR